MICFAEQEVFTKLTMIIYVTRSNKEKQGPSRYRSSRFRNFGFNSVEEQMNIIVSQLNLCKMVVLWSTLYFLSVEIHNE